MDVKRELVPAVIPGVMNELIISLLFETGQVRIMWTDSTVSDCQPECYDIIGRVR